MKYHFLCVGLMLVVLVCTGCGSSDSGSLSPLSIPTPSSVINPFFYRAQVKRPLIAPPIRGESGYVILPDKAGIIRKVQAGNDLSIEFSVQSESSSQAKPTKVPLVSLVLSTGGPLVSVPATKIREDGTDSVRWSATLNVPTQTDLSADPLYDRYLTAILMVNLSQDSAVSGEPISPIIIYYPPAPAK
jgi:hypothetical protein